MCESRKLLPNSTHTPGGSVARSVHRARLRDGRQVAVKVQRPGIRDAMLEDLDALDEIAEFLDKHTAAGKRYEFCQMLDQFRKSLLRELDYRQEATNLTAIGAHLKGFERIIVPAPILDYSTSRVLTMQYVHGKKVTDLHPLARMEFDGPPRRGLSEPISAILSMFFPRRRIRASLSEDDISSR